MGAPLSFLDFAFSVREAGLREGLGDTVDPDYGMVREELSAGTSVVVRRCRGSHLESPTRGWVCDRTMMSLPLRKCPEAPLE